MINHDLYYRITELSDMIRMMESEICELKKRSENRLWDNVDMIRNWKVSIRTLANWRAEGLIGYIKVRGKIWYPIEMREDFIKNNLFNVGRNNNG